MLTGAGPIPVEAEPALPAPPPCSQELDLSYNSLDSVYVPGTPHPSGADLVAAMRPALEALAHMLSEDNCPHLEVLTLAGMRLAASLAGILSQALRLNKSLKVSRPVP